MLIRPATAADLPAINAIYNHFVLHSTCTYQLEPSTPAERLAWFHAHGTKYPVTVLQSPAGEIIGWASLSPFHPREAYRFTVEDSIYVHHAHHRQGIGKALLADLLTRAAALDYRHIIAIISADQQASIRLHAAQGFKDAGLLRGVGFKFNQWLDVAYMQWSTEPEA